MTDSLTHTLSPETIARALGLPIPTPEQQAVIAAPLTPALVVAGAGSGKTETMSGRVVWLVANGLVQREEILGLTFTRKAAGELAERIMHRLQRIDEFAVRGLLPHLDAIVALHNFTDMPIGDVRTLLDGLARRYDTGFAAADAAPSADQLLRPRVATYNAFADAIVREHAARIGRDTEASMLSQAGSWLLARSVVLRSRDDRLIETESALATVIDAVQNFSGAVLDNRVDVPAVVAFGDTLADELEEHVDSSLATKDDTASAWAAMRGLGVVAALSEDYALAKRAQGVLDFADQVAGALQIVEQNPDVTASLREQYRVVLLDEYQDTSVLQTQLLATIFRDHGVMAVGDPHQSIYGWRGASADNLEKFPQNFAHEHVAQRFSLMTSWRNARVILQAANALLASASTSGVAVGKLQPSSFAPEGTLDVSWENTIADEATAVADWFVAMRDEHAAQQREAARNAAADGREFTPKEHTGALLFRAKKHMQLFADALGRAGVPHRILGLGGLLSTPEVTDVVSALRVVHDPTAGSSLLRILAGPRFGVGVADLAALHDLAKTLSQRDAHLMKLPQDLIDKLRGSAGSDEAVSIIDALDFMRQLSDEHGLLERVTAEGRARLRDASTMFDRLRRAGGRAIPELIRMIEIELRLDIELSANESRGPARIATIQLRAFLDEVRAFLEADGRGTIGSLLAWLDHAEDTDELMPRAEPVQPGVVQLLTVHGSKGLEWDSVAVVRLVTEELPKRPKTTRGWLGFGTLPYAYRGDSDALPEWTIPPIAERTRSTINKSIAAFKAAEKLHQEAEERRLAYVAVTRAKSDLLLSGSWWSGQIKPRTHSPYLVEMIDGIGREPLAGEPNMDDKYERGGHIVQWPSDPLGARRTAVETAAVAVRDATAAEPTPELAALLAERDERAQAIAATAPARIPASMFKDFVHDYRATVDRFARPMPERPFTATRLGTDFHTWVEHRFETAGTAASLDDALWQLDSEFIDATDEPIAVAEHDAELARLQANFEQSEWAGLLPLEVECEVNYVLQPPDGGQSHIMICKLDAVFERDGRIEVVDWKTGRAPATPKERAERMLQLAHYRLAYHHSRGVPLDQIDVALYYVGEDVVLRPNDVLDEAGLAVLLANASS